MIEETKQIKPHIEIQDETIKMQCQICMNEQLKLAFCKLDCPSGHIYHARCIQSWVKKGHKNCPVDRKDIQQVLTNGQIKKIGRPLDQTQRCFLCNQPYQPQNPKLKCMVCQKVPCHQKCLKTISTANIPDFNRYQTCEQCQYQLRRQEISQYQYLHSLSNKLSAEYYRLGRQIQQLQKKKKMLKQQQDKIYQSSGDVAEQLNEIYQKIQ